MGRVTIRLPAILTAQGSQAAFQRVATDALNQIGREAVGEARRILREDRDVRGYRGRIDRGIARASVTALAPVVSGVRGTLEVVSQPPAADYWPVIEEQRTPGRRMPPVQPIHDWLRRTDKGRALTEAAFNQHKAQHPTAKLDRFRKDFAFVVARSIGRKGTPGLAPFRRTADLFSQGRAAAIFATHAARVLAR